MWNKVAEITSPIHLWLGGAWSVVGDEDIKKIMIHTKEYVKNTHLDGTYPSRRLPTTYLNKRTWENPITVVKNKNSINVKDFKTSTTGHFIGYCNSCNESSFYKEFQLRGDSSCCSDKINSKRRVVNGVEKQPYI